MNEIQSFVKKRYIFVKLTIVYRIYFLTMYLTELKSMQYIIRVYKIHFILSSIYIFEYGIVAHYV